jgi:hypothetical protein
MHDIITVTYVDALPGDAWTGTAMISLPLIPDNADPALSVGFEGDSWFAFNTTENDYAGYTDHFSWFDPATSTPGRGFWAKFGTSSVEPYGTLPDQNQVARVHLKPGWNMIGDPFISPVTWDTDTILVQETGLDANSMSESDSVVASYAWGYDANSGDYVMVCDPSITGDAEHVIKPWLGYWIKCFRECDLIFSLD